MRQEYRLNSSAFESEYQLREFINVLKGRGMVSLKFAYTGRAAHEHDRLVRSQDYHVLDAETTLIHREMEARILPQLRYRAANVIDIGSGNGMKAIAVLQSLSKGLDEIHYLGLDYSNELSRLAHINLSRSLPSLDVVGFKQIDFELGDFRTITEDIHNANGCNNVLLLLGLTLGNPFDRLRALHNIRESMLKQDVLLLGVELFNVSRIPEVMSNYENEVFRRAVFCPLTFVGLTLDDGSLQISFNTYRKNVEVHFQFRRQVVIYIGDGKDDQPLEFEEGERLLIFISHRFELGELLDLFSLVGLAPLVVLSDASDHAIVPLRVANAE